MSQDWKQAWQPLVDRLASPSQTLAAEEAVTWAPDAVEAGAIRRWLEPLEFECPLHHDRAAAQAQGYADIVAPATCIPTLAAAPLWRPGTVLFDREERNAQPMAKSLRPQLPPEAPQVSGYFATDIEFDFLRPVLVGERLGRRPTQMLSCTPKETKVGRGAFLSFETQTLSSKGDLVARMRYGLFCYEPHPAAPVNTKPVDQPKVTPRDLPAPLIDRSDPPSRGYVDVIEGEMLEPLAFPLTVYRLVVAAGANRDFNAIHHNGEFARASGAPDLYANNLFLQGMWERVVRRYVGPAGVIHTLRGFRMSSFNCAGDTVLVRGQVLRKWQDAGRHWIEIKLWSENSQGISVGPGSMTVSLPH